jgi:hypothetical protein
MTPRALIATSSIAIALLVTGCSTPQTAMSGSSGAMSASPTAMMTDAMSAHGSYVTYADYSGAMSRYDGMTIVYYFCSSSSTVCQQKEAALMSGTGAIPAKVTIVKVDFDMATDVKQKYGVMVSDTFVKVDSTGAKAMTWSGQPVSDVLAALKG